MRFFVSVISLCTLTAALAQNPYQLFQPGVTYLYNNPYATSYGNELPQNLGIRVDSLGCEDTYYTLYPGTEVTEWGDPCFNYAPTFIGRTICQTPTTTTLIAENRDSTWTNEEYTLQIEQTAPVGTQWIATQLQTIDSLITIWARVDSIRLVSILGVVDSVKYINFFEGTPLGELRDTTIFLPLNVSQQYGLVDGFFTHQSLADSLSVQLVGLSFPGLQLGLEHPTLASVFNQEIGDEWHIYQRSTHTNGMYDWYYQDINSRMYLREQWMSPNGDTLWQVVNRADQRYQSGQSPIRLDTTYADYIDTLIHDITELRPLLDGDLAGSIKLSTGWGEMISVFSPSPLPCETVGIRYTAPLTGSLENTCFRYLFDVGPSNMYLNRFGGPFYNEFGLNGVFIRRLDYFHTADGEACGTPYDFIVHTTDLRTNTPPLKLFPNPTHNLLHWNWLDAVTPTQEIQVLNAQGQIVASAPFQARQINVTRLPTGVYWLRWQTQTGDIKLQRWIRQ